MTPDRLQGRMNITMQSINRAMIGRGRTWLGKDLGAGYLVAAGAGRFVVADMDEILTDGDLLGATIAGSGREMSRGKSRRWSGGRADRWSCCAGEPAQWSTDDRVVWTHLDCTDAERRWRLVGRLLNSQAVEQLVADAHALRSVVPDRIL